MAHRLLRELGVVPECLVVTGHPVEEPPELVELQLVDVPDGAIEYQTVEHRILAAILVGEDLRIDVRSELLTEQRIQVDGGDHLGQGVPPRA